MIDGECQIAVPFARLSSVSDVDFAVVGECKTNGLIETTCAMMGAWSP